jgi:DNA-directed RNA polymerase subunit RPC12/RpoP
MEPITVEGGTPHYRIRYRCQKCGHEFLVKTVEQDDPAALVALAHKRAAQ